MSTRRGFLSGILAAGFAPAIGHAGILMPVRKLITPPAFGAMWTDDAPLFASGVLDNGGFWVRIGNVVHIHARFTVETLDLRTGHRESVVLP